MFYKSIYKKFEPKSVSPAIKRSHLVWFFLLFINRHPELDSGSIQNDIITIGIDRFRVKHGMTKYPPLKKSPRGLFFVQFLKLM